MKKTTPQPDTGIRHPTYWQITYLGMRFVAACWVVGFFMIGWVITKVRKRMDK